MKNYIALRELCRYCNLNYESTKKYIERHPTILRLRGNGRGRPLFVSIESLIAHGVITREQADEVLAGRERKSNLGPNAKWIANEIVLKKFENLSNAELEFMTNVDVEWRSKPKQDLRQRLAEVLGCSERWLRSRHDDDRRKYRKHYDRLTPTQQDILLKRFTALSRSKFVETCMQDEALPRYSLRTWYRVYSFMLAEFRDHKILVRQGPVALSQHLRNLQRDPSGLKPGEIYVTDYWRVDIVVRWPDRSISTPYLCLVEDVRTRMRVGFALTQTPNSLGVKMALYTAFTRYGVCDTLYIDNGKEFDNYRVTGGKVFRLHHEPISAVWAPDVTDALNLGAKGMLPGLRVRVMRAERKNPRAKVVEGTFRWLTSWAETMAGWVGSSYGKRSEHVALHIKEAKKSGELVVWNPTLRQEMRLMTIEELAVALYDELHRYNRRASKGFAMDGKSPEQLWNELTRKYPVSRPPLHHIALHFLDRKDLKVRQSGYIVWQNHHSYWIEGGALRPYRGRYVQCRYNPLDMMIVEREDGKMMHVPRELVVFSTSNEYIGTASYQHRLSYMENRGTLHNARLEEKSYKGEVQVEVRRVHGTPEGSPIPIVRTNNIAKHVTNAMEKNSNPEDLPEIERIKWLEAQIEAIKSGKKLYPHEAIRDAELENFENELRFLKDGK